MCVTRSVAQCGAAGATCTACGANADTCDSGGACRCGVSAPCATNEVCSAGVCVPPGSTTWTQRILTTPPAVNAAGAAWDSARQVLVVFGGRNASVAFNTTWELGASGWTQRAPVTAPSARYGHDLAYDPIRQRVVLFGGFQSASLPRLGDTWEWNGTSWTQIFPSTAPSARSGHRMAWDPVRQHIVLFGGRIDGSTNFYQSDTWAYVSGAWTLLASSGPTPREGGSVVWDPGFSGGRIVTFGGVSSSGPRNDTWAWDGSSWQQVLTATAPSARVFFEMSYQPVLGKVVLFGGSIGGSSGFNAETWVFDRTTWTQLTPATSPPARNGHVMEWDPVRQKLTVFGGFNGTSLSDQWEL